MAWVRFTADFDWSPHARAVIAYKGGQTLPVTRRCAEKAIAEGKAERLAPPSRPPADPEPAADG